MVSLQTVDRCWRRWDALLAAIATAERSQAEPLVLATLHALREEMLEVRKLTRAEASDRVVNQAMSRCGERAVERLRAAGEIGDELPPAVARTLRRFGVGWRIPLRVVP